MLHQLTHCSLVDIYWAIIDQQIHQDIKLQRIISKAPQHRVSHLGFTMDHGRLLYKGQVVRPNSSPLVRKLLYEYHCSVVGGTMGS